jgi:hypothetical protein
MKSSSVQLPRVALSSGAQATSREAGDIGSGQHVVYLVRHSERMDEVHSHALQLIRTERDYFGYWCRWTKQVGNAGQQSREDPETPII